MKVQAHSRARFSLLLFSRNGSCCFRLPLALHHGLRTGSWQFVYVVATLNLVARGLAEGQPESAAVIQGTATAMVRRLAQDVTVAVMGHASSPNSVEAFVVQVRRDTTHLLTIALGEVRLHQLRAEGAAMDDVQACRFARTQVDEYLAGKRRA